MQKHPIFAGIVMHSDDELEHALGASVVERQTIHQWPLSCVQRMRLNDGTQLIYKSQLPPTVEAKFYGAASSTLLPDHRRLGRLGDCDIMTIEWIDAPLLRDAVRTDDELTDHGRQVISQIAEIRGDLPTYLNIGSSDAWSVVADTTIERLGKLVQTGHFPSTSPDAVGRVRLWTRSTEVIDTITRNPRLIHGDLTAQQVFVTAAGYRVIDWQRPVIAPPEVDLVALLVSRRIDPRRYLNSTIVGVFWFLHLHWAVEAQFNLFPDFRGPLFDQWSSQAIREILR